MKTEVHKEPMETMIQQMLNECDKEPIHIPGKIQSIGFMILIDHHSFEIVSCSKNTPASLANKNLKEIAPVVYELALRDRSQVIYDNQMIDGKLYTLRLHQSTPYLVLEAVEKTDGWQSDEQIIHELYGHFKNGINIEAMYQDICNYLRGLTGYDRVMLYRFDPEFNGEVVAESCNDEKQSYLNHHFPASDIPVQARLLYVKNRVRFIASVDDGLIEVDRNHAFMDMSHCVLRSVSPLHIEYLKNMDVTASMSLSILINGRLWGLIACHHAKTKTLSLDQIRTLTLMSHILSQEFFRITNEHYYKNKISIENDFDMFARAESNRFVIADENFFLARILPELARIFRCDSCALVIHEKIVASDTKIGEILEKIRGYLRFDTLFYSHHLGSLDESLIPYSKDFSGALGIKFGLQQNKELWLFRQEVTQTVLWAGNPVKPLDQGNISPRKSFQTWEQIIKGQSLMWESALIDAIQNSVEVHNQSFFLFDLEDNPMDIIAQASNSMILTGTNDADNPILYANQAFYDLYGYSAEETIGNNPRFLQQDDRDQIALVAIRDALLKFQPISVTLRNYTKNGDLLYVEVTISPIFDHHSGNVKYYLGTQKNVTKEQKILQDLKNIF